MTVASPGSTPGAGTRAVTALVLGIFGLFPCCFIVAPVAWYLADAESRAIRAGLAPREGEGVAKAGLILGMLGTIELVVVLIWVFFVGGMAVLSAWFNR